MGQSNGRPGFPLELTPFLRVILSEGWGWEEGVFLSQGGGFFELPAP